MPHNIKKWIQTAQHASPILRGTLNQLEDLLLQTILINWRNQSGNNIFHWFANHLNQDNVIIGILLFRALLTNPIHFNLLTEPNNEGISAIELLKQQYINRNNLKKIYNKNDLFTLFKNNNQINPVHHIPMNSETESASNIVKSLDTACIL